MYQIFTRSDSENSLLFRYLPFYQARFSSILEYRHVTVLISVARWYLTLSPLQIRNFLDGRSISIDVTLTYHNNLGQKCSKMSYVGICKMSVAPLASLFRDGPASIVGTVLPQIAVVRKFHVS